MLTNKTISKWADELWDGLNYDMKDSVYTLRDGREIKLEIIPDDVDRLDEFGDIYGAIQVDQKDRYTGYSVRPYGFNGAARKFSTRDDDYWWQPPADLVNDADNCRKWFEIVRGYYNQDWWYVGVCVTIDSPNVNGRPGQNASLWGIESNAGEEYFKEIIRDLIREAYAT